MQGPAELSLVRAPTDNDLGGSDGTSHAARWLSLGLDRELVASSCTVSLQHSTDTSVALKASLTSSLTMQCHSIHATSISLDLLRCNVVTRRNGDVKATEPEQACKWVQIVALNQYLRVQVECEMTATGRRVMGEASASGGASLEVGGAHWFAETQEQEAVAEEPEAIDGTIDLIVRSCYCCHASTSSLL